LGAAGSANAAVYEFNGDDVTAWITTSNTLNAVGGYDVTSIVGAVTLSLDRPEPPSLGRRELDRRQRFLFVKSPVGREWNNVSAEKRHDGQHLGEQSRELRLLCRKL
jgi:hypothetical protein